LSFKIIIPRPVFRYLKVFTEWSSRILGNLFSTNLVALIAAESFRSSFYDEPNVFS